MTKFSFLYTDQEAFATSLITAFISKYSTDALEWEPKTIQLQIEEDEKISIPRVNMDKLQAAIVLLTTNQFYQYYEAFENIGKAFIDNEVDFENDTPLTSEEIAWTIIEARIIDPPEEEPSKIFSAEVKNYIRTILEEEGWFSLSEIFSFIPYSSYSSKLDSLPSDLREKAEDQQKVKHLRVKGFLVQQYNKLKKELAQFFGPRKIPTLQTLLEGRGLLLNESS